ncbi:hypothetical protein LQ757_17100 [Agromyces sp. SYSU K20354]|uniref:hypothetical protein n=1 Tax=Agromyces cavernae TaxID=2898659 RepID=UPI001E2D67E5|nr:hypothetical protein [Agromyces cavernae]MCD2444002.1 hypothetical protein [Agromyces cavernae]
MNRRDDAGRRDDAASESPRPETSAPQSAAGGGVRAALTVVSVLLFLEAAVVTALVVWLVIDLISLEPSSYVTAIALIAIVVIGAIWVWAVAIATLRRAPWARAAAIVWQILQLSVAVGAFQGLFARPDLGWALLVPAITVIGLLLWTPVRIAYSRHDERPDAD